MPQAQVWYKELANGDRAVAAYNSGTTAKDIEVDFSDVGFATTTPLKIVDLFSKQELQFFFRLAYTLGSFIDTG